MLSLTSRPTRIHGVGEADLSERLRSLWWLLPGGFDAVPLKGSLLLRFLHGGVPRIDHRHPIVLAGEQEYACTAFPFADDQTVGLLLSRTARMVTFVYP